MRQNHGRYPGRPFAQSLRQRLRQRNNRGKEQPGWLHEIKHDGFPILARRDSRGLRLFTRNGYNFAGRFPTIVAAITSLPVRSCLIDGEAIVVDESGLSVFELLRYRHHDHAALLCAFDLIELDGNDLRRTPIEERKDFLAELLNRPRASPSTSITSATARCSSSTPARSAARASCRSASARPTAPVGLMTG